MKKITFTVLLFLIYLNSYSQSDTININNTFDTSQTFYTYNPSQSIYGIRINGSCCLNDYNSFARVILVKKDSTELLIYEAYPWLYSKDTISFYNAGDETYYLEALDTTYIKIEIVNANISITTILFDTTYNSNIPALRTQYISDLRQNKIDSINNNIQADTLLWLAGDNDIAQMPFYYKKKIFSNYLTESTLFNTFGLEYYKGGIFSINGYTYPSITSSSIVENFDWRNRHGVNWNTNVRDQGSTGFCWAFSPVASLEATINLYYNQHLNKDLSEKAFVSCRYGIYRSFDVNGMPTPPPLQAQCGTIPSQSIINCFFKALGAMDECCYPYTIINDQYGLDGNGNACLVAPPNNCDICANSCIESDDYLQQLWKIDDFKELNPPNFYHPLTCYNCELIDETNLKEYIILNGPQSFIWLSGGHAEIFVGFGIIHEGDILYGNTLTNYNPFTVPYNHEFIGATYWIAKNSFGDTWGENGYGKYRFDIDVDVIATVIINPITPSLSSGLSDADIQCIDTDGDGYYWWGIGNKPATCPAWVPDERDCDDSDPFVGPYDQYYNCSPLCEFDNMWTEITNNTSINKNAYLTTHIKVKNGNTLTIENGATLFIHPNSQIVVENNASLVLNNGSIKLCGQENSTSSLLVEVGADFFVDDESLIDLKDKPFKWTFANVNTGIMINAPNVLLGNYHQLDNGIIEKYCYNNVPANCELYGGLYQWDEAMQYNSSVNCDPCDDVTGVQGICPPGYHIPSDLEWSRYEWYIENNVAPIGNTGLATFQNNTGWRGSSSNDVGPGDKLKAGSGYWDGTNASGFLARPSGIHSKSSPNWSGLNSTAYFWSSTENNSDSYAAYYRQLTSSNPQSNRSSAYKFHYALSVRCLKN